jgi:hypothetical protein
MYFVAYNDSELKCRHRNSSYVEIDIKFQIIVMKLSNQFIFNSGLEIRDYGRKGSAALTTQH